MKSKKMLFSLLSIVAVSAQLSSAQTSKTLIKVGNTNVTVDDFKYVYDKNSSGNKDSYSEQSLKEYLELYTNFRLKVKEAEDLKMDTSLGFKQELEGYRKQLAQPYLTEKNASEKLVRLAYERSKEDVKAAHILLKISLEADPKDTLAVYNKLVDIREKALKGESFEKLAKEYSDDPSAKENGGVLGYFNVLQMVHQFEDAAYSTQVGKISMPIRTKFGYHIVKVIEKRAASGQITVSHIMSRYNQGGTPEDSTDALNKINEIYSKLKENKDWKTLCAEFSDDQNSKDKGGVLPPFSTGNMIPSFEEAAFGLKNKGDYTKPIQTPYGFHILKLEDRKGIATFEESETGLKQKVAKDSRSELNKTAFIDRLKSDYNFKESKSAFKKTLPFADSSLSKAIFDFKPEAKVMKSVLFTLGKEKYSIKDFFKFVKTKQQSKPNASPAYLMEKYYKDYVATTLTSKEENNLESKYLDYKMLLKEYRDGILLFSLMDSKVWTKAMEDTTGLKKYFADNQSKYVWKDRTAATIFSCIDNNTLLEVKKEVKTNKFSVSFEKQQNIVFAKNKSALTAITTRSLETLISGLSKDARLMVNVSVGSETGETKNIGEERKKTILSYFKGKGVDEERVSYKVNKPVIKSTVKDPKTTNFEIYSTSLGIMEKSMNSKNPLTVQITEGKFQKGENAIIDSLGSKIGNYEFTKGERKYLVQITKNIPAGNKLIDECKGSVISDYQIYLEKEWISDLRKKYPVDIDNSEFGKLIKK